LIKLNQIYKTHFGNTVLIERSASVSGGAHIYYGRMVETISGFDFLKKRKHIFNSCGEWLNDRNQVAGRCLHDIDGGWVNV
jgi:hypothetical protein